MRRLVKEEFLKFDGTPLFPERYAVTGYVQNEFNRAEKLNSERRTTVGFALMVLQRRLASSPEAIYQSLYRRRERLEDRLKEERLGIRARNLEEERPDLLSLVEEEDEFTDSEIEAAEDAVSDAASASQTIEELEAEIATLTDLEALAEEVKASGTDRKWRSSRAFCRTTRPCLTRAVCARS